MRSPETSPRLLAFLCLALFLVAPLGGLWSAARASSAAVLSVGAVPPQPTVCDSVTIGAAGQLPNSCYQIESAVISGPEPPNPLCEAIECPSRFEIRITVRAPDPAAGLVCPDVIQPYRRTFPVGPLAAGAYAVRAVEVVLPAVGSSGTAPAESTEVSTIFFVQPTTTCPPGGGCVILGIAPAPSMPVPPGLCTTAARPGGQATFALALHNEAPVAGVQTEVGIYDLRLDPGPNGPLPGGTFTPKSVEAVGRASGFQVDWTADGGALKAILFSTSGAAIPPGDGAILRITYGVGADTRLGSYAIVHFNDIVSDPEGNALPFCPTLRETSGWLCVVGGGCDVNGDGASDIRDIVGIVRCALASGGAACPDSIAMRADCNGDGAVDVRDVICCVRKILATRLDSLGAAGGMPQAGPGPSISFLGDVTWTTPVEGLVGIRVSPDAGAAGVEWVIRPSAPSVRVHDIRVVSGGVGVHLEWSADGSGHASAMLYSENGGPLGHDVTLELSLDRVIGSAGPASIRITDPLASGSDGAAEAVSSDRATAAVTATSIAAPAVYPARPNPFVGSSEITFALPRAARATLRVFDVHGRLVRTLVDGPRAAGVYHEQWDGRSDDGRSVSSGIYLLSFRAGGAAHTQRLLRLR